MKKLLFILMGAAALMCRAQDMDSGMKGYGFRIPEYNDQGQLRAQLYGEYVKAIGNGEVKISNLKIEMYKDGKVTMTGFAPNCFYNREMRQAHSEGRVLIEFGSMTVVGRGFTWSEKAGCFEVLHDAKVLVKEDAKAGMKELEP